MDQLTPKQQLLQSILTFYELLLTMGAYEDPNYEIIAQDIDDGQMGRAVRQIKKIEQLYFRLAMIKENAQSGATGTAPFYWNDAQSPNFKYNPYDEILYIFSDGCGYLDLVDLEPSIHQLFEDFPRMDRLQNTYLKELLPNMPEYFRVQVEATILPLKTGLGRSFEDLEVEALELAGHGHSWTADLGRVKEIVEERGDLLELLKLL